MSAKTAQIILRNRTLRWSSPIEFNDPFDIPREILFGIDTIDIQKAASECFIEIIKNPPDQTIDLNPKIQLILEAVKNADPDIKKNIINEIESMPNDASIDASSLEKLKTIWRGFIPEFRVLCLCETNDTVSMWYHYADKYKGVVIEFDCNDDLDSAWLVAEPVKYVDVIPEISSAIGWARILLKSKEKAIETLFKVCAFSKTPDWSYEKEWRIASFKRPHETGTVSDYKFNTKEIKSVYLGPLIEQNHKSDLLKILNDNFPDADVYNSEISMNRTFIFSKIRML
jgi:hypothetical protein